MPLANAAGIVGGGLLLLAPFSNRAWSEQDQAFLAALTDDISRMISRSNRETETAPKTVPDTRIQTVEQDRLLKQNQALRAELERVRDAMKTMATRDAMTALQNESRETILSLQEEIEELRAAKGNNGANTGRLSESRLAGQEVLTQGGDGEKQVQRLPDPQAVNSTAMDLRQPVTAVMGYTELLLSESVGILGSIQKKYLERIRNAAARMSSLVDHLVEINHKPTGLTGQSGSQTFDLASVFNRAAARARQQISEKKVKLRLDLPEDLPVPMTDTGILDRVIDGLLQNAGAVTPVDGIIRLTARKEVDTGGTPFLLIQVTDSGGGIGADDLPRVFSPQTSGVEPAIAGISDDLSKLPSLKALVESQAGRMWVDSQAGLTTTFSVLFPVQTDERAAESQK